MLTQPAGMLSKSLKSFVVCALACFLCASSAHADDIKLQRQGEYTFITGGNGDDDVYDDDIVISMMLLLVLW
jgi:hypothetical protein